MNIQNIYEKAMSWMLQRGWKKLTAKRRQYEQSLFEHTMVELDALLSLLPILKQPNHFSLTEEEEKILIASIIAHDAGKEKPDWQEYLLGKRGFVSDVNPVLTEEITQECCNTLGFENIIKKIMHTIETSTNRRER